MSQQNYEQLINTTEFTRMWAEGYTPDEIVVCLSMDFMTLDEDMNSICTLTEEDVQEGYNFLDTKMKKHFLAVYELED